MYYILWLLAPLEYKLLILNMVSSPGLGHPPHAATRALIQNFLFIRPPSSPAISVCVAGPSLSPWWRLFPVPISPGVLIWPHLADRFLVSVLAESLLGSFPDRSSSPSAWSCSDRPPLGRPFLGICPQLSRLVSESAPSAEVPRPESAPRAVAVVFVARPWSSSLLSPSRASTSSSVSRVFVGRRLWSLPRAGLWLLACVLPARSCV
jgi:hypothetical protein